jgi:hypothetical protein
MNVQLDDLYFEWLYDQISTHRRRRAELNYFNLMRIIFKKEFVWLIPNDDNRVNDGTDLRTLFIDNNEFENVDPDWYEQGCSMLEMLIGLAHRYAFETNQPYRVCFWEMITNLGLHEYNDAVDIPRDVVEDKLDKVIWRTYSRNGRGGLFPLQRPVKDQRDVELWYQLSAYIIERRL